MNEILKNRNLDYRNRLKNIKVLIDFEYIPFQLKVDYKTKQLGELIVYDLSYDVNVSNDYLPIIDYLFELLDGKPVEVFDRITLKELDFYIRKDQTKSVFSHFSNEHFEIIGIGKKIYKSIINEEREEFKLYDQSLNGEFSLLSLSEQIEFFEEFSSYFIYPYKKYQGINITISDIEDDFLYFESSEEIELIREIQDKFNLEFNTNLVFKRA